MLVTTNEPTLHHLEHIALGEAAGAMAPSPMTLADLLEAWRETPPREVAMLRNTCVRLSDYHGASIHEVTIDEVEQKRKGFRPFLEARTYAENSIRTYVNHVRILLDYAGAEGWRPADTSSPEWAGVLVLAVEQKCADLARHLLSIRNRPREVTAEDVDRWVLATARTGGYDSATGKRMRLWRILRDCGYVNPKKLPKCLLREKNYGIPVSKFPLDLKTEVTELLKWKQDKYVWDREAARHRPTTARRLAYVICALYGYAVNIAGITGICSLSGLAKPHIVGPYTQWCIDERDVKGQTLQRNLRLLDGVLRQHPKYANLKLDWFKKLLDRLPVESDAVLKKRRAERVMEYAVVERIPEKIRAQRAKAAKKGAKKLALVVRDELMMRWLPILPWRQRNIRECRIGGANPNLYKGPVPAITTIDMPLWALDEQKKNPNAEFWQFHFTEEETKTGCTVDSLLPVQLVEPLEEYLNHHRPHLVQGDDPQTLFLNQVGTPMSLNQVTGVVATNTLKYAGRRVTPHPFRDIVSFAWLKAHSKDYLTLSKMLWHANPNEVIKTYGSLFNESSGVCSMEAWLEERKAKPGK